MKTEKTKVIFRKWTGRNSGILALFPEISASVCNYDCMSYEHIGQHGGADYQTCIKRTKPATPAEYADLKAELESLGYCLDVKTKTSRADFEKLLTTKKS